MFDCVIIGGGPAGLTAAIYLGRFRRRITVIDAGESRLKRIPCTRNVPGFPDGIEGPVLQERMHRQAGLYGATFQTVKATQIRAMDNSFSLAAGHDLRSRTVLLATGVATVDPPIAGLDQAIARGVVRFCPICDGYEAADRRIAVLGGRQKSIEEAFFLRTWSSDVTYVAASAEFGLHSDDLARAKVNDVKAESRRASAMEVTETGVRIDYSDGNSATFDVLYPCLGVTPRNSLALSLGATLSDSGGIQTDRHQETSVRGLYAAGDVVEGLDQIASACGQAAIAATAIHNRLRELDG
jgi:thioredoxin reductase (NADPH)